MFKFLRGFFNRAKDVVEEVGSAEMVAKNSGKAKTKPAHDKFDEFECGVCGRVCKTKAGLSSHMRTHE